MSAGSRYIKCIRNCALMKCPDEETQSCSNVIPGITSIDGGSGGDPADKAHCHYNHTTKWCRQYEVRQVTATDEAVVPLGFIPRTYYCHDAKGAFTQEPGRALKAGFLEFINSPNIQLGDCTFEDGETLVKRNEAGDYAYCNGQVCNNTFHGGYQSRDYDPRYRDWYIRTRKNQLPNWSPPYPFFSNLDLGITYSHPIYSVQESSGRNVFEGVLAVDYSFAEMSNFLVESYKNSSTVVVIFEAQEPDNFMVASSTGRKAASKVLAQDKTQPCLDDKNDDGACIVVRKKMKALEGFPRDSLLVRAYETQKRAGYPKELLSISTSDFDDLGMHNEHDVYIVQSSSYNPGGELEWIVLVISPAGKVTKDYLVKEDSLFGVVCVVASLGFILCLAMFISFYRRRNERAIILADWRFTTSFLLGCALLNLSSFTLLGENTDALCLSRIWSFHFLFSVALSPLFVKVWRMWRMVGTSNRRPTVVNNATATLLSMPIIAIQAFVLFVVTLADPPRQAEMIESEDGIVTQRVVCEQDSSAFEILEVIFEAGLVLIGCVLAYITRNLDSQFGDEAKQLMFSMYNIAFIGIITIVIVYTMDIDTSGQIVLQSIGVFWGTVFSSAAFVLPRLMRVQSEKKIGGVMRSKTSCRTGKSGVGRESKVRFSVEEHKSGIASVDSTSGTNEKNERSNKRKDCVGSYLSKPCTQEKEESQNVSKVSLGGTGRSLADTPSQNEDRSGAFPSGSFDKNTGWSAFERDGSNASVGSWSNDGNIVLDSPPQGDTNSKTGDSSSSDASMVQAPDNTVTSTNSNQMRMPSEELNMATKEGGNNLNKETDHRDPLV